MKSHRTRFLSLTAVAAAAAMVLAACSSGSSSSGGSSKSPILIGTSLSLTGDFSADGQAFQRGYQLWESYVNSHGGLLGRKVKMVFLNDQSDPTTVATNYTKLIAQQHVALVFGPFSTLLTVPAAKVAARYGYAFPEGAGGGPSVYALNLPNVFNPSPPIADQLVPFADWVASLPASERPKTAAYPQVNDPFADPMTEAAQAILQKGRRQDGLLEGLSGREPRLQGGRRRGGRDRGPDGRARLGGRAYLRGVHPGVRAAALQPEDLRRHVRARPGRRLHQGDRRG